MTVPRTPIGNAPPRANQLNPEDDDEFINVANNQENQQLPINDDFENDQKRPFSSSNEIERVCTAEEAAVLAAQFTAERLKEALKTELTAVHQSNDERLKKLESMIQGLQKENAIKNTNAKMNPAQNALLHSILRSPLQPRRDNTDDASKASTDCTTSPNNSQIIKPRKPPSFSNNAGQNAAVWLRQMQNYLNLANIDSSTWVVYAETYLDNDALQWWVNYLDSTNSISSEVEWSTFCMVFLQRFQTVASEATALTQLQTLKQAGNLDTYIDEFLKLSANISYAMCPEPNRVVTFLNGLRPYIQRFVTLADPTTLQEAIAKSRQVAATYNTSSSNRIVTNSFSQRTFNQFNNNYNNNVRRTWRSTNSSVRTPNIQLDKGKELDTDGLSLQLILNQLTEEQKKLIKENRCFACKEVGHRLSECSGNGNQTQSENNHSRHLK